MNNIKEIFYNGKTAKKPQAIKTIPVDWDQHAKGVINIAKSIEPNFKITEENKKILKLLLLYFTGNPLFSVAMEEAVNIPGSLSKGIFLIGGVGTGKSLMFKIFKQYTGQVLQTNSFIYLNSVNIVRNAEKDGVQKLNLNPYSETDNYKCYIDDIASTDENINHFGSKYNVMSELLTIRYNMFSKYGTLTHLSSNKFPKDLGDIYDLRIVDRMREMFNIIEVGGESFRK